MLAHVPDINDFVDGLKHLLAPTGVLTMEFPHLQRLIAENQFDTIYHEHFSYLSFLAAERIFAHHGIVLFDVDELPTHGGSLRIYGRHADAGAPAVTGRVNALRQREIDDGFRTLERYRGFGEQVKATKRKLLAFLIDAKQRGKKIVGYGAPGKGNTLLNYCGIRTDFLDFTVDANPYKQGTYTPGTRIPILPPEAIRTARPGLRSDPSLESEGGDHGRGIICPGVGRTVRRADSRGKGALAARSRATRRLDVGGVPRLEHPQGTY